MKTVAHFSTVEEAHLLRTVLAEEGIEAFVLDENMGGSFLGTSSAFADIRVQVAEEEEELARPIVEQFTGRRAPALPTAPIGSTGAKTRQPGVPLRLFQVLSLALLALHFINGELQQSADLAVSSDLRQSLEALGNVNAVKVFGRFSLVYEVMYCTGLLGFAALWRGARESYLIAWIWMLVFGAVAGGSAFHGLPVAISGVEWLMGGFLLGVSWCPPAVLRLGSRTTQ